MTGPLTSKEREKKARVKEMLSCLQSKLGDCRQPNCNTVTNTILSSQWPLQP